MGGKRIIYCTNVEELERGRCERHLHYDTLLGDGRDEGGETMIGAEGLAINILVCGSFFG
jgi:hypothetical protein